MTTPSEKQELHRIDQNQYRFNIACQLRLIESNRAGYTEEERQLLKTLLTKCSEVDGNKLNSILSKIYQESMLPVNPATNTTNTINTTKRRGKANRNHQKAMKKANKPSL